MKVVIFAAGNYGKKVMEGIREDVEILCFVDNDSSLWGGKICGFDIVAPSKLKLMQFDFIIIATRYFFEIREVLVYKYKIDYKKIYIAPISYTYMPYAYGLKQYLNSNPWRFFANEFSESEAKRIMAAEYIAKMRYNSNKTEVNRVLIKEFTNSEYDANRLITLNDKIRYLEANTDLEMERACTDKYLVRKYVEYLGLGDILVELYFVANEIRELDLTKLPSKFVLKQNNGCGYNIICRNKDDFDLGYEISKLKEWWEEEQYIYACEWHYENIDKKIICEQLIESEEGKSLVDYKYFCCNGKIACILVCDERDVITGNSLHYYFDNNWKALDYATGEVVSNKEYCNEKPQNLDEMNSIAEKLARYFPFVRVDLYNVEGKIYFGELTFTPCGGLIKIQNDICQKTLGDLIDVNYMKSERKELYHSIYEE